MNYSVLIPAYNPDEKLLTLVQGLVAAHCPVVIVDDGSEKKDATIFDALAGLTGVVVLRHETNQGKGEALKTGMAYLKDNHADRIGIVCVDADGQHSVDDALKVGKLLEANPMSLILGVREFQADVPWRSRFGNCLTRCVFHALTGLKLSDTQSGLRGIPMRQVPHYLKISAHRYEFEMEQLVCARRLGIPILETPIQTIYAPGNRNSHFNPILDSLRIYFVFIRFMGVSLFSAGIDYAVFMINFMLTRNLLLSQYLARMVSGGLNYTMNRKLVFRSSVGIYGSLTKYIALAAVLAFCSYLLIRLMVALNVPVALAKPVAESLLFGFSFMVQRSFVLKSDRN